MAGLACGLPCRQLVAQCKGWSPHDVTAAARVQLALQAHLGEGLWANTKGWCHSPVGEGDTESEASLALCPWTTIIQFSKVVSEVQGPARPKQLPRVLMLWCHLHHPCALGFCKQNEAFTAQIFFPGRGSSCKGPILPCRAKGAAAPASN